MFRQIIHLSLAFCLACNVATQARVTRTTTCQAAEESPRRTQTDAERSELLNEAEKNKFVVRRVEFFGNSNTRHDVLARRVVFQEGDLFTRALLERSLRNLSKLRIINPVRLKDVEVHLDREAKEMDFNVLIREKRRSR